MPINSLFQSISKIFNCNRHVPQPAPFPFRKLPLDIQDRIVKKMDFKDLIQAALAFSYLRRLLARGNFRIRQIDWTECTKYCFLRLKHAHSRALFWIIVYHEKSRITDKSFRITKDVFVTVHKSGLTINAISELVGYQLVMDIIFEAFKVESLNLGIVETEPNITKEFLLPIAHRYMNIAQKTWLYQSSCSNLTSDELTYLLDHYQKDQLKLTWHLEPGAKYSNPLMIKNLLIDHGNWLSIDNLSAMKCEVLEASDTIFTALELRKFVDDWLEGGFEGLKKVQLKSKGGEDWGTVAKEMRQEVRRSDGRVAMIYVIGGLFKFDVCFE